jgi:hypothetical protein
MQLHLLMKLLVAGLSVLSLGVAGCIQSRSLGVQVNNPRQVSKLKNLRQVSQPKVLVSPVVLAPMSEHWSASVHG